MPATSTVLLGEKRSRANMLSYRNLTWLGASAIFLFVSALLAFRPALGLEFYPLFALIFFWTDYRLDSEIDIIFVFLAIVAAGILGSQIGGMDRRLALGAELMGVVLVSFGLGLHRESLNEQVQKVLVDAQTFDVEIQDLERDLSYFTTFETTAAVQIGLRRDLTLAAKSLGSTLDRQEVQRRLLDILTKRYADSKVHIVPGQSSDRLIMWAVNSRSSVMVRDIQTDDRFTGGAFDFRSAIISPLSVMKRPVGFARLESAKPDAYSNDDLRTVDLFATVAGLALENIQYLENVNDLASHDALTQLFTHRAFQTRLQEEVLRAGRSQQALSIIMCDVDHFKKYNDRYGHQAGDTLLRTVAGILTQTARPIDFVARYGGEEFSLILPGMAKPEASALAEEIRRKVEEAVFTFGGHRTSVTMSFGVSSFPADAMGAGQILHAADERLYRSKNAGRNQVSA